MLSFSLRNYKYLFYLQYPGISISFSSFAIIDRPETADELIMVLVGFFDVLLCFFYELMTMEMRLV